MTKDEKLRIRQAIVDRKTAYTLVFGGEDGHLGQAVLHVNRDLEKFCRMNESTFHVDARVHSLLEGRREVMLRIRDHLTLSVEEILLKYDGRKELLHVD